MMTDSLSQSMLAAGLAWTLQRSLWSVWTRAYCAVGASTQVIPTEGTICR